MARRDLSIKGPIGVSRLHFIGVWGGAPVANGFWLIFDQMELVTTTEFNIYIILRLFPVITCPKQTVYHVGYINAA